MRRILFLLLFQFLISHDIYKEIRIDRNELSNLSFLTFLGIDVDHIFSSNDYFQFVVNDYDLNKLINNNIDFQIIHEDIEQFYQSRLIQNYESRDFDYGSMGGYYTLAEIEENLDELSNDYPEIFTSKFSIGQSLEGRDIWAIKVSDNPNQDEDEPEALYTGLHHAREPMSYMNLFYFMYWLGENYETDILAQHLVNNRELWFIPAVNPDGLIYNQSIAPNGGGMQRKNIRETCNGTPDGVDLNRNYSYMWGYDNEGSSNDGCGETYRGNGPFSEPETQAVRDFVEMHDFPIAFNYHSYSNLLIYPFGYEYENNAPQEDVDIMIEYGQDMTQFNNYELGTGPDLLYPVNGEACDWMYGVHGIFAYTPEIGGNSDGFWPATNRILPLAEENLYPNQVLALNVGSKYEVVSAVNSSSFSIGESYPLSILISNKGMGSSNGQLYVDVVSSDNLIFELENIILDEIDARETIDLGEITYFQVNPMISSGSVENIIVNVYDNDGYVYSDSIQIIVGETINLTFDSFENSTDWIVGDLTDNATAGIWEIANPNPTYNDEGQLIQPNSDHSDIGENCFITENGTSSNLGNAGQSDVDGGKTTLYSPIYDLSSYQSAILSYWKWYTNNQGNNAGTDVWKVEVSNNAGLTWTILENTTQSTNSWDFKQFLLNDYINNLSNQIQFRFIAEDIFNEGDQGTGGSLVEAAIDDFSIDVFIEQEQCSIGDLNQDDMINIQDVVILISVVLQIVDLDEVLLCVSDLNQDSNVDVLDVVLLVNFILS